MSEIKVLSETPEYQSILSGLTKLDDLVRFDFEGFAKDHLQSIDDSLWQIVNAVEEGVI